jgi:hypothetical protein
MGKADSWIAATKKQWVTFKDGYSKVSPIGVVLIIV